MYYFDIWYGNRKFTLVPLDLCSQVFVGMLKFVQNYPVGQNQAVRFFDIENLQKLASGN